MEEIAASSSLASYCLPEICYTSWALCLHFEGFWLPIVTPVRGLRKSPQAPPLLQILSQLALPWRLPFMFIAWGLAFFSPPSACGFQWTFSRMLFCSLLALPGSWPVLLLWIACSALRTLLGSGALGFPCPGVNSHFKPHKVLRCYSSQSP